MNTRIQKIVDAVKKNGHDGIVISKGSDIKYLTGFTGEYGVAVLLLTEKKNYFVTDGRFEFQAAQETEGFEVVVYGEGLNYFSQTGKLAAEAGVKQCAICGADLTFDDYQDLVSQAPDTKFVSEGSYVEPLRAIKTPEEIETIEQACRISERSFYALLDVIKPGVTEIDIANELENYTVRQEHGVNVYGLDDFPAEYVQVLDGELNTEQWKAGNGVYVTPLRMMGDGSLCLYKPGDQISVTQLDGTNKVYDVLAVVSIPSALQTPLQVDMGLDYIFPTNELLGNMVSADQPAMKTIFNVDEEHQLATENWLKNYTTNTDTALDYLSKVTLRQTFDGMINMDRLVGGALCAILALIGILNFINSITTSILSRYREIAMLQSVGMTGRQVKQMLIYEGIGYSILGLLGSLILSIIASLTVVRMMGAELTYFTWHFTLLPVFLCIIPLILITAIVPLVCYNKMAQKTVVERLRIAE